MHKVELQITELVCLYMKIIDELMLAENTEKLKSLGDGI